ncbi:Uma2 family endonuclease [Acidobacteria bacterium ACD]|nr:MAG: Uma2 family endonuclease [Acidobacteriota bacterium]MCE7958262.1 Uma2 family endonuclease [Acidobacteria bacterium ACB2]MDL1948466.1 Uma2 family endonuclease [Acidobacteria bacterium ACD]
MPEDAAPRKALWTDLSGLPEGARVEVLEGELVFIARPTPAHQLAAGAIGALVGGPFCLGGDPGGWWVLQEVDVELAPHCVFQPDVAGWLRSRLPAFPAERPIRVVPDWVCEVLSPPSARVDRVRKAAIYLEIGVQSYWIVNPADRTLEAWQAADGRWLRLGAWAEGDRARIAPFEAVELDVGRLFPPAA